MSLELRRKPFDAARIGTINSAAERGVKAGPDSAPYVVAGLDAVKNGKPVTPDLLAHADRMQTTKIPPRTIR